MKQVLGVATLSLLAFTASAATALPTQVDGQPMPSLAPIVQRVAPAVVNIGVKGTVAAPQHPFFDDPNFRRFFGMPPGTAPREREFRSAGSGVIVDGLSGYIVTNAHVVSDTKLLLLYLCSSFHELSDFFLDIFSFAHLMATGNHHEPAAKFRLDRFRTGVGLMDEEGTGSQHNLH